MQAHATLAQYSLEAKILGVLLVLPYSHTTTVDDIAAAAYAEYQLLNPRAPPQKVLCVRDASGRILSGKLNLIKHNVGTFVDVQVEEWFHADVITQPEALDEEYRKWQMWTGRQVHEMILDSLSAQTSSGSISSGSGGVGETESLREEWIALLDELSHSPSEKVQQMCIRSLQVLRQKSRSERQVRYATSKLVSLLQVSDYVSVVTSVLSVFQRNAASLLPLSQYHAEEVLMLTATIDLDALIGRFPEHHEALVRGFSNLYTSSYSVPAADEALEQAAAALSGDLGEEEQQQEVQRLKDGLKPLAPASALERQAGRESRGPLVSSLVGAAMQAAFSAPPDPSLRASNERLLGGAMTTSRVLALMQSDDPSMRRFALDKLHAMLLAKAEVPPPDEAEGGRHSSRVPSLGLNGEEKKPDPTFFPAEADVSALAIALFRALRESLGSRSSSASPSLSPSASPTRHEQYPKLFPASHSKPEQSPINQHQLKQKLKQKQEEEEVPKARRLIHAQLDAEDCDVEMLRTVMSCLIVCCTSQRPAFNSLRGGGPSSSAHMIAVQLRQDRTPSETPEVVSQWLSVFARAGEPWAKLLITLAHIRDEVLAEPFAFLAQAVLDAAVPSTAAVSAVNGRVLRAASTTTQLQQQHYGWDALQVKLDAPAVAMLLECEPTRSSLVEPTGWAPLSIYGRNFRRGLALQWLSYLSASKAPAGREQRGVNNGNKKRRAGAGAGAGAGVLLSAQLGGSKEALPPDGAEELAAAMSGTAPGVQTLLPLLRRRDWDLVLRLWSLATAPNLPSRQHRRQAMVALANISALAEVAHVLERVYALAKLLVFLSSTHVCHAPKEAKARSARGAPPASAPAPPGPTPSTSLRSPRAAYVLPPSATNHLDLPLVRSGLKFVFNLVTALPRQKQKALYGHLDDLRVGGGEGKEDAGGVSISALAQGDEVLMFYWTSLTLTVQLDAREKSELKARLDRQAEADARRAERAEAARLEQEQKERQILAEEYARKRAEESQKKKEADESPRLEDGAVSEGAGERG